MRIDRGGLPVHSKSRLQTKAGEVRLRVPKLRQQTFETAIIERYRRRESSVEEALIVSGRGIGDGLRDLVKDRVTFKPVTKSGYLRAYLNGKPCQEKHPEDQ